MLKVFYKNFIDLVVTKGIPNWDLRGMQHILYYFNKKNISLLIRFGFFSARLGIKPSPKPQPRAFC